MDAIDRRGSFAAAADEAGTRALHLAVQNWKKSWMVLFDRSGHRTIPVRRMLLERARLLEAADIVRAEALARGKHHHCDRGAGTDTWHR